jgi:hypothetical protein
MWASLKIEAVGDNVRQEMMAYCKMLNAMEPGLGNHTFGKIPFTYWVARLTGFDDYYGYKRQFLKSKKDYTEANSKGSRGVYLYFLLETGEVYEAKGPKGRYFCVVTDDGDIDKVTKEYVDKWLKERLVLPY